MGAAHGHGQHVVQHRGLKSRGVAVDEHEQRIVRQHLLAGAHQAEQLVFQLPHLAARAASVAGRIHQDALVAVAPALLALHELQRVVDDPAHAGLVDAGQLAVLARPLHHALGGVHVGDLRARRRTGAGRAAGVAEQVQHADGAVRLADEARHPVPVHRLLREQAGVLEAGGAHVELQLAILHAPALRQLFEELPLAAALGGAVVVGVRLRPELGLLLRPDRLGIGAAQYDVLPALQLLAVAGIDDLVILPFGGNIHRYTHLSSL